MSLVGPKHPLSNAIKVNLWFRRSQLRKLRRLADWCRAMRPKGVDVSLYDKAADSARDGDPLTVICSKPAEAELIADGFVRLGIARPRVDYNDRALQ